MSITTALKARREQLRDREAGFTLIELLVVVIIIGILAAIAIPVYIGVQNNAKDSSAKSDLANAKIAVRPSTAPTTPGSRSAPPRCDQRLRLGNYGWSGTTAVDGTTGTQTATQLVHLRRPATAGTTFYITPVAAPTSACTAHDLLRLSRLGSADPVRGRLHRPAARLAAPEGSSSHDGPARSPPVQAE